MRIRKMDRNESLAEIVSELSVVVYDYLDSEGYDNPDSYYDVSVENVYGGNKKIVISAELMYDGFKNIENKLNNILHKIDRNAYFQAVSGGLYEATVSLNGEKEKKDSDPMSNILNKNTLYPICDEVAHRVAKDVNDPSFDIDDIDIVPDTKDPDVPEGTTRLYVQMSGDRFESLSSTDIDRNEVYSRDQVNHDLPDMIYKNVIDNIISVR